MRATKRLPKRHSDARTSKSPTSDWRQLRLAFDKSRETRVGLATDDGLASSNAGGEDATAHNNQVGIPSDER